MNRDETNDYQSLLRDETPILDVRAPAEFAQGAIASAVNIPILDDEERESVGLAYKHRGQNAAVARGHELVQGQVKSQRIEMWREFIAAHPNAVLCCWRGGMRSQLAQAWLAETGIQVRRISGGSKALRQHCMAVLEHAQSHRFVVLAGRTGSGKTELLRSLHPSIDLEGLANHRGSAFGALSTTQPKPVTFEFSLATQLLNTESDSAILLEDESTMIGRLRVPEPIVSAMSEAPIALLLVPREERIALTYDAYVAGTSGGVLCSNLSRIQKRLGDVRYKEVLSALEFALERDEMHDHHRWIGLLLDYYYDPMYDYQLSKKTSRIEFEGNPVEVRSYLATKYGIS